MTLAEIDRMPARERDEWWTAYTIEPWGEQRVAIDLANQTFHLISIQVPKKDAHKIPSLEKLMPNFLQEPKRRERPKPEDRLTPEATADLLEQIIVGGRRAPS